MANPTKHCVAVDREALRLAMKAHPFSSPGPITTEALRQYAQRHGITAETVNEPRQPVREDGTAST